MLLQLNLRDFVIVSHLTLDFQSGFSALTGETGAGKSILIDAIALLLGAKTDTSFIRQGCNRTILNAEFSIAQSLQHFLNENDLENKDDAQTLLIRRVIEKNGKSRAYVNENNVSLTTLKNIGEFLVDIHGQHAHQSLLKPQIQRELLDSEAALNEEVLKLKNLYKTWQTARQNLQTAQNKAQLLDRERERLTWQKEDLELLAAKPKEWEELENEEKRLSHAAQFLETIHFARNLLFEEENPLEKTLRQIHHRFESLAELDSTFAEIEALFSSIENEVWEIKTQLERAENRASLDPERLNIVNNRLADFLQTARKYRIAPETLPEFYNATLKELENLEALNDLESLEKKVLESESAYFQAAKALTEKRKSAAKRMSLAITQSLKDLAMGGTEFSVAIQPLESPAAFGLENVEFLIGYKGGELKPLAKIASGGELSRISLAIQVFLSSASTVPTLIFDEVDVGIGGAVAEIVGRLLRKIAENKQILCVTHLPQVAARAHHQWQVKKAEVNGEILSSITLLDSESRKQEIARMLGGVDLTEITLAHAQELLNDDFPR